MSKGDFIEEEIESEIRKSTSIHIINTEIPAFKVGDYFSSYNKIIRFLAWMHRFFVNRKNEVDKRKELKVNNQEIREFYKTPHLPEKERKKLHLTFAEIKIT